MKVVVIDDSRLSVSALQNMISKIGHEVVGTAFDGEKGIEVVKSKSPDVVCLDFVMPGKDGMATAQAIRTNSPSTKIIMITQKALEDDIKTKIAAIEYVLKPITLDKLERAFKKA